MENATSYYEQRESELTSGVMRDVERQVMLRIIDQRWREHLEEMDYLQEGINLRAMGQKDPLAEWQREGYEMFGAMMKGIAQDFVKYVMHVQVVRNDLQTPDIQLAQPDQAGGEPQSRPQQIKNLQTSGASGTTATAGRSAASAANDWSKTPRNAPCPCGTGKKYKQCHGKVA
jgi:preprotein translocase subunit SecA